MNITAADVAADQLAREQAEECAAECAAEAANERALYGPTEAMMADYEAEAQREAFYCDPQGWA